MNRRWRWVGVCVWLAVAARPAHGACLDQGRPCCDYCRMIFQHDNFGGEITTADTTRLTFDATECMAAYWFTYGADTARIRSIRSIPFDRPHQRPDARKAWYLLSDSLPSPMAVGLSAYATAAAAQTARRRHGGRVMRWNDVVAYVRGRWKLPPKQ